MSKVRTVLGDVEPSSLRTTHCHEHVLFDPIVGRGGDFVRTEQSQALEELGRFRSVGGSALVDATVEELGREPAALESISTRAGVHLVAVCGHTAQEWWDGALDLGSLSETELVEGMIAELSDGIGSTSVRAGVIKIGTSLNEITETEARIIRAAGTAHRATGAPVTTHTTAGTMALDQIRLLDEAGVDLSKVCIGHLDRRLVPEEHLKIARTGVYLGYDQVSKEKYAPDEERARLLALLVDAGFADRLVLGSDLARRSDLVAWGGSPGLNHLSTTFVDMLRARGLGDEVSRFLVDNPARFLAWA